MKPKRVSSLSPEALEWLQEVEDSVTECDRTRQRARALRLSNVGYSRCQLAEICQVCPDTISAWINAWESEGVESLLDNPRSGRPCRLNEEQAQQVLQWVEEEPRQLKRVLPYIQQHFKMTLCLETLKRLLKKKAIAGSAGAIHSKNAVIPKPLQPDNSR